MATKEDFFKSPFTIVRDPSGRVIRAVFPTKLAIGAPNTTQGTFEVNGAATVRNGMTVTGTLNLTGTLYATGTFYASGTFFQSGSLHVSHSLIVGSSASFDSQKRFASAIGTDVWFFVSGSANVSAGSTRKAAVFGGDVVFSGSLSKLTASIFPTSDVVLSGTYASRPAAASAYKGRIYLSTDVQQAAVDEGGAWRAFGPAFSFTKPPASSTWTTVNHDSNTCFKDHGDGLFLSGSGVGQNHRIIVRATPSAPWRITALIQPLLDCRAGLGTSLMGILIRDSSNGKFKALSQYYDSASGNIYFRVAYYNTFNSFNSQVAGNLHPVQPYWWLRMEDDNTSHNFYYSADGVNFQLFYTESRTTFTTASNQAGFSVEPATSKAGMTIMSWKVE